MYCMFHHAPIVRHQLFTSQSPRTVGSPKAAKVAEMARSWAISRRNVKDCRGWLETRVGTGHVGCMMTFRFHTRFLRYAGKLLNRR